MTNWQHAIEKYVRMGETLRRESAQNDSDSLCATSTSLCSEGYEQDDMLKFHSTAISLLAR